mgnify:CR=1 FL=1
MGARDALGKAAEPLRARGRALSDWQLRILAAMRLLPSAACWVLAVAAVYGCDRRGDDDGPSQPVVQQPTAPVVQPVVQQPGVAAQPGVQATSIEQRMLWAEQRIARLEQQATATAQETQALRQQLAQTQMELRATQEQMRAMQSQARNARRQVQGMMRNAQGGEE